MAFLKTKDRKKKGIEFAETSSIWGVQNQELQELCCGQRWENDRWRFGKMPELLTMTE